MDRRTFLGGLASTALGVSSADALPLTKALREVAAIDGLLPPPAWTNAAAAGDIIGKPATGPGSLWLVREADGLETRERFWSADAGFDMEAIGRLSLFFCDVKGGYRAIHMNPQLFSMLATVWRALDLVGGRAQPLILTSGYRTPARNATIEGAAKDSMHLYGFATDAKRRGFTPAQVAVAAASIKAGGIGIYRTFTHMDIYRARCWTQVCPMRS